MAAVTAVMLALWRLTVGVILLVITRAVVIVVPIMAITSVATTAVVLTMEATVEETMATER
jgi:hypothetical protein